MIAFEESFGAYKTIFLVDRDLRAMVIDNVIFIIQFSNCSQNHLANKKIYSYYRLFLL